MTAWPCRLRCHALVSEQAACDVPNDLCCLLHIELNVCQVIHNLVQLLGLVRQHCSRLHPAWLFVLACDA